MKTNPQKELGDMISEPCLDLHKFGIIVKKTTWFLKFLVRMFTRIADLSLYLCPV